MARRFHRKKALDAVTEINVTPLIDLAFALLIIFMITAPLLEQSIDINLPSEMQKEQVPGEDEVQTISINAAGRVYWSDRVVTAQELDGLLLATAAESVQPVIHIRADAQLPYQRVIEVVDAVKRANLNKISLDTQVD